jgi:hypothetical protein
MQIIVEVFHMKMKIVPNMVVFIFGIGPAVFHRSLKSLKCFKVSLMLADLSTLSILNNSQTIF